MRRPPGRRRQRGVALIIALILVALATILATKITFDGYMERRRSIGMLAIEQAWQFSLGAEALAADALSQDLQNSKQDTLAEPWAQRIAPMQITPEDDPEGEPIGVMDGGLEDMQGRFNLNNLARLTPSNQPDPQPLEQFERLLTALDLEPKWAQLARDWLTAGDVPSVPFGAKDAVYTAQDPPYRTGNWPMTTPTELMALPGFGIDRYRKLAPYVTALPTATSNINICTAPAVVLESLSSNLTGEYTGNPDLLANGRKAGCFPDMATFGNTVGPKLLAAINGRFSDSTSYFRLTTRVTLGTTEFTLYSLLLRGQGGKVTPILRSFGTL
ncbi:MAG: type II secretion system minor pseudopilin GspK [Steroidobacteraceae bacterium]|jgi:general secretion pathway protein K